MHIQLLLLVSLAYTKPWFPSNSLKQAIMHSSQSNRYKRWLLPIDLSCYLHKWYIHVCCTASVPSRTAILRRWILSRHMCWCITIMLYSQQHSANALFSHSSSFQYNLSGAKYRSRRQVYWKMRLARLWAKLDGPSCAHGYCYWIWSVCFNVIFCVQKSSRTLYL
jgi:hypothetical protein